MQVLGIRDIIGPVMIGPSSSHTAGALRIALTCRHLLSGTPTHAVFRLYGSFAKTYHGHGTDKALVAGLLGMTPDNEGIRDSFERARAAGLTFEFLPVDDVRTPHPNTVDIDVTDSTGALTHVRGESIGGGAAVITRINSVDVYLTGEYHSLVVRQRDAKGVLAHIAGVISTCNVNIATTRLYRERKGDIAYTIMETDDRIPSQALELLLQHPDIYDVRIIASDRSSGHKPPERAESTKGEGFGANLTEQEAAALFEQLDFAHAAQLLDYCEREGIAISEAICRRERAMLASNGIVVDDTRRYLLGVMDVMRASIERPLKDPQPSMGGLLGGEGKACQALGQSQAPCDPLLARVCT